MVRNCSREHSLNFIPEGNPKQSQRCVMICFGMLAQMVKSISPQTHYLLHLLWVEGGQMMISLLQHQHLWAHFWFPLREQTEVQTHKSLWSCQVYSPHVRHYVMNEWMNEWQIMVSQKWGYLKQGHIDGECTNVHTVVKIVTITCNLNWLDIIEAKILYYSNRRI